MIKVFVFCLNLLAFQKDTSGITYEKYHNVIISFKQLLVNIREYKLTPQEARNNFQEMMLVMKKAYPNTSYDSSKINIVFPLLGFDYRAIGGKMGSGYIPDGYDLFDQGKKGSHPAHDIFMKDRNQDSKDDRTGQYVEVVSVSDGVVLAIENNWQPDSDYRGGNYIWIYDTKTGGLWYYAHQRKIFVTTGQSVKAGQKISLVGRTGFNAAKARSDTHLHLTHLRIDEEGNPFPVNTYEWLKNAAIFLDPRISVDLEPITPKLKIQQVKVKPKKLPLMLFRFF